MDFLGPQNTSWWRVPHLLWSRKQRIENEYPNIYCKLADSQKQDSQSVSLILMLQ